MKTRLILNFESLDDLAARSQMREIVAAIKNFSDVVDVEVEKLQEVFEGKPPRKIVVD